MKNTQIAPYSLGIPLFVLVFALSASIAASALADLPASGSEASVGPAAAHQLGDLAQTQLATIDPSSARAPEPSASLFLVIAGIIAIVRRRRLLSGFKGLSK